MSIYVLIEYVERCKKIGMKPNWIDLKIYKAIFWRD